MMSSCSDPNMPAIPTHIAPVAGTPPCGTATMLTIYMMGICTIRMVTMWTSM